MKTITDRLYDAINSAKLLNITPKSIYLGADEWEELDALAKDHEFVALCPLKHGEQHRTEFAGLQIYQVDAKSHLQVI